MILVQERPQLWVRILKALLPLTSLCLMRFSRSAEHAVIYKLAIQHQQARHAGAVAAWLNRDQETRWTAKGVIPLQLRVLHETDFPWSVCTTGCTFASDTPHVYCTDACTLACKTPQESTPG